MAEEPQQHADELARAVAACQQALVDYQAGLFDEEQLRRTLYEHGMVLRDNEAWMLDVDRGTWRRYDGISTEPIPTVQRSDATQPVFDAATLRRWQVGLRGLQAANPLLGVAGG